MQFCVWIIGIVRRSHNMSHGHDIVLMQGPRGPRAPALSPFVMKLETFLRLANINYRNDHSGKNSPKGKTPWLKVNGRAIADSQFCIDFLKAELNLDVNSHLTKEEHAIAHAFQKMADENLYWCLVISRLNDLDYLHKVFKLPKILLMLGVRKFRTQTKAQGMGRHSMSEMEAIMEKDMKAISDFLGSKKFLMGDKACEADCALFGQLSQFCYQIPDCTGERLIHEKYTNLKTYCETMKVTFWPDWEECITKEGTKKATK